MAAKGDTPRMPVKGGIPRNVHDNCRLCCCPLKDVRAQKFTRTDFFKLATQKGNDLLCQKGIINGGSPTSFWKEHAPNNTLNLKNRASLANKATVSVSPKILQLDL